MAWHKVAAAGDRDTWVMTIITEPPKTGSINPWATAAAIWTLLVLLSFTAVWQLRQNALTSQTRELEVLSLALTEELERGLRGAEEGLLALRSELHEHGLPSPAGATARQALQTRADLMPLVKKLWLVDRDGVVLGSSAQAAAPDLHSFAPALDSLSLNHVAVSRPFDDGAEPGSLVALAMRLPDLPNGRGGWILAAVPASALLGAFTAALPATDARMGVFRGDGVLLASANAASVELDESAAAAKGVTQRQRVEVRTFHDGSENLVALHATARYDIKVVVSRDLAAVLLPWREMAEAAGVALALLLAIKFAAIHLVQRADRRHQEARRAFETRLARSSKLKSLGTLAGGVAHDFNNVLTGIVGFAEMAQDAAVPGSDQARHLAKALQAAERGKALVERVLSFSRGAARVSTVFELEPVVDEVLTLLSASLRAGVVLERAFEAPGARVRGDPTQAFEAVLNLCTNAMEAMPDEGLLSVRLERQHVSERQILSHTQLPAGDFVVLSVSDQGSGMSPDVMEHLFEPFFTTRAAQSGTGLGLAVVFGVVAEFGGAIHVRSNPGQGASFIVYLPLCQDVTAPAPLPQQLMQPGNASD